MDDDIRIRYLLNVYFGRIAENPVRAAVKRAYLDFARTQHGFANNKRRAEIQHEREEYLIERISTLCATIFKSQEEFDYFHRETVSGLQRISQNSFSVGQAQKWINMSIKYCAIINPDAFSQNLRYYHVPIDNILLTRLHGYPQIGTWSRLEDYELYLRFQNWFREQANCEIPLIRELQIWERE